MLNLIYLCESLSLGEVADYWRQVIRMNDWQKRRFSRNIVATLFNTVARKRIAILGFAFKKDTGDTRESPAIDVCRQLLEEGALLAVSDPKVSEAQIRLDVPRSEDSVSVEPDVYAACVGAHAVAILTEYAYRELDWERIYRSISRRLSSRPRRRRLDPPPRDRLRRLGAGRGRAPGGLRGPTKKEGVGPPRRPLYRRPLPSLELERERPAAGRYARDRAVDGAVDALQLKGRRSASRRRQSRRRAQVAIGAIRVAVEEARRVVGVRPDHALVIARALEERVERVPIVPQLRSSRTTPTRGRTRRSRPSRADVYPPSIARRSDHTSATRGLLLCPATPLFLVRARRLVSRPGVFLYLKVSYLQKSEAAHPALSRSVPLRLSGLRALVPVRAREANEDVYKARPERERDARG